ncbi:MAG: protein dithiol-disulfide isomerase [Amycolatopsis sp.]|uniref:DsbA family oxidoreductase n=1 Tax=Amycolatopsis sp. TaxID=37632 RepID=UPI002631FEC6|nr:DsbA family oxidoreductase [Amycolatopsis sp.]MCU1684361.1 protein dithiol-disulfide isomerase [Amycolatopsis sp.]
MRVDVWADLVCPWCYLGKRRFERALAEFEHADEVEVVHHSFQLDPTFPRGEVRDTNEVLIEKYGMTPEQAKKSGVEMEERAAADGLEYTMAGLRMGNTVDAHQLVHLGAEHGIADTVMERLYRAHFTEGRSLFDHDSLVELAADAGLDAEEARRVLTEGTYAAAVEADGQQARSLGANGVPFFVLDERYGVSGAQPTELFAQALDRAWSDTHASA